MNNLVCFTVKPTYVKSYNLEEFILEGYGRTLEQCIDSAYSSLLDRMSRLNKGFVLVDAKIVETIPLDITDFLSGKVPFIAILDDMIDNFEISSSFESDVEVTVKESFDVFTIEDVDDTPEYIGAIFGTPDNRDPTDIETVNDIFEAIFVTGATEEE